ncbi:TraR/DksA family transcriptional regulator [Quadrisphaera setariae]|uniref:TraR/DksA family transcriptional regulator n=1 Tax=Quadrisphaera setariae TaxID=2593304 RepID=UPI002101FF20|nr:TraR/DksA family transcriptional regulator [Quadrisphaera setariae]
MSSHPPSPQLSLADVVAALEAERADATAQVLDLDRAVAGVVEASRDSNADDEHDPEGATIAFERAQAIAVRDRQRSRLREVDAALGRVADGTFGRCERCGCEIAPGRLLARPTSHTCVTCADARR